MTDGPRVPRLTSLLLALLVMMLVPVPRPGVVKAQATRCPEAAAQALPLTSDQARGEIAHGESMAAWRINGAVGKVDVRLTGLSADLDLFVCGPDGQIAG